MGELDWDLLSSYAGILTLACGSVYAGSFGSLPVRFPADKEEDVTEDEEDVTERMSSNDAWLFPVFGSFVLFGFYLVIKYLGKEWINWFLGWY
ncbi:hypothetical protein E4T56_gene20101, partial [Termitomyces sp. T112]